jgi:hypothetical protein
MTKKKRRTAPGLVADRSRESTGHTIQMLATVSLRREVRQTRFGVGMGMGLPDKGPNAFAGTVDGYPRRIRIE